MHPFVCFTLIYLVAGCLLKGSLYNFQLWQPHSSCTFTATHLQCAKMELYCVNVSLNSLQDKRELIGYSMTISSSEDPWGILIQLPKVSLNPPFTGKVGQVTASLSTLFLYLIFFPEMIASRSSEINRCFSTAWFLPDCVPLIL